MEIFEIFLREVGAGRRGRRPLQAGSKVDACPRHALMPPPFAACKKGESTVSGTLPMRLFKILLVLFF